MKILLYFKIFLSASVNQVIYETVPMKICGIYTNKKESAPTVQKTEHFLGMFYGLKRINIIFEYLELLSKQEEAEILGINTEGIANMANIFVITKEEKTKRHQNIHCGGGLSILNKSNKNLFDLIRKRENGIFISSEFQSFKNAFDIPCLCGLEEEIQRIITKKENSTKKKFDDCIEAVSKSLLSNEWDDIKICSYFIKLKHIYKIIKNLCLNCHKLETKNDIIVNSKPHERVNFSYGMILINMKKKLHLFSKEDTKSITISFIFENIRSVEKGLYKNEIFLKMNLIKFMDSGLFSIIPNEYKNAVGPIKDRFKEEHYLESLKKMKEINYEILMLGFSFYYSKENLLNLMIFMKSPFGVWVPVKKTDLQNHRFITDNYEVLHYCEEIFNFKIYRLKENGQNKHLAVHIGAKIDVGFIWENGVIIEDLTVIEKNVQVNENTHISSNVIVKENSLIGKGCTIFDWSRIYEFSVLEDNVVIFKSSLVGYDRSIQMCDKKPENNELDQNSLVFKKEEMNNQLKTNPLEIGTNITPIFEKTIIGSNSIIFSISKSVERTKIPRDSIVMESSLLDAFFEKRMQD